MCYTSGRWIAEVERHTHPRLNAHPAQVCYSYPEFSMTTIKLMTLQSIGETSTYSHTRALFAMALPQLLILIIYVNGKKALNKNIHVLSGVFFYWALHGQSLRKLICSSWEQIDLFSNDPVRYRYSQPCQPFDWETPTDFRALSNLHQFQSTLKVLKNNKQDGNY